MDSIDKFLSELKAEYQQPANSQVEKIEEVEQDKKVNKINISYVIKMATQNISEIIK